VLVKLDMLLLLLVLSALLAEPAAAEPDAHTCLSAAALACAVLVPLLAPVEAAPTVPLLPRLLALLPKWWSAARSDKALLPKWWSAARSDECCAHVAVLTSGLSEQQPVQGVQE
jgi:hypothetical protein